MAVGYHTHSFTIQTADAADLLAGTESGKVITPGILGPVTASGKALLSASSSLAQQAALGVNTPHVATLADLAADDYSSFDLVIIDRYSSSSPFCQTPYKKRSTDPGHAGAGQDAAENWFEYVPGERGVNAKAMGAIATSFAGKRGAITATDNTFVDTSANFTAADVGATIVVQGAGTAGANLTTTIASRTNATTVELTDAAVTTVSAAQWFCSAADDTTALQRTLDAAVALGVPMYMPSGGYNVTGQIVDAVVEDNIVIEGDGKGKTILYHNLAGDVLMRIYGTPPVATASCATLTSAATALDQTLTLSSTTGMAPGDYIYLEEQDAGLLVQHPCIAANQWLVGEVVRIRSVDSGTQVTLEGRLENAYTSSSYARLASAFVDRFTMRGFSVVNAIPGGGGLFQNFFAAYYVKNLVIEDVVVSGLDDDGIVLQYCIDFRLSRVDIDDLDNSTGNTPYGINVSSGCWVGLIEDGVGRNGRHYVTSGGNPATAVNCSHIDVVRCKGIGQANAFDTHAAGRYWRFSTCTAIAGADSPAGGGFQIRNRDTIVSDCLAVGCGQGYFLTGGINNKVVRSRAVTCDIAFERAATPNGGFEDCIAIDPVTTGFRFYEYGETGMYGGRLRNLLVLGDLSGYAYDFQDWFKDEDFEIRDLRAPDATDKYYGIPHGRIYGHRMQSTMKFTTMDREDATTTAIFPATGRIHGSSIILPKDELISEIGFIMTTNATGQTNLFYAIYDDEGNFLGQTADQGSTAPTTNVLTKLALVTPFKTTYAGVYYPCVAMAYASGSPQWRARAVGGGDISNGTPALCGYGATTGLTDTAPATQTFSGNASFAFACVN